MISSRWQLVLQRPLTFILSPSQGERRFVGLAGEAPALQTLFSAFGAKHTRSPAIARLRVCRPEFRRRICAQYLRATECSRARPESSAHNRRAFQNRGSSGA
jgi:hypothetical protein